jgi:regulator of replication initiation timing
LDARENVRSDIKVSPRFEILMKEVYNIKDEAGLSPEIDKAVKLEISHLKDRIQETRAKNETEIHLEIN